MHRPGIRFHRKIDQRPRRKDHASQEFDIDFRHEFSTDPNKSELHKSNHRPGDEIGSNFDKTRILLSPTQRFTRTQVDADPGRAGRGIR